MHSTCIHCTCVIELHMHMKIHVPSMLTKGIETIKKQTQQTSRHNGLENS